MHYNREKFRYSPFFCEENIWWLASSLRDQGIDAELMQVLFFSNSKKSILMFNQRGAIEGHALYWDYHVVLQARLSEHDFIFDFDTRLSFPSVQVSYLKHSFPFQRDLPENYRTWVRCIPATHYLVHFYSDRKHMQNLVAKSDFPDYPIIQPLAGNEPVSLDAYWDMQLPIESCQILSLESLINA